VDKFKITNDYVLRALDKAFYDDAFRTVGEELVRIQLLATKKYNLINGSK
jgi:hypothetical protein